MPIPRIIAETAVRHNKINKTPPDKSITDCVNFSPRPDTNTDPIFVVGLPRSGSTLVEQILSSHSLVEGTTELQNIIALSRKIANKKNSSSKSQYPSALKDMKKSEFKKMGKAYIQNTLVHFGRRDECEKLITLILLSQTIN